MSGLMVFFYVVVTIIIVAGFVYLSVGLTGGSLRSQMEHEARMATLQRAEANIVSSPVCQHVPQVTQSDIESGITNLHMGDLERCNQSQQRPEYEEINAKALSDPAGSYPPPPSYSEAIRGQNTEI